jgi:hypothetical protein
LSKNDSGTRFGSGVGRRRGKGERMEVDYLEGQFLLLGSHVQDLVHTWELVFAYVLRLEREREREREHKNKIAILALQSSALKKNKIESLDLWLGPGRSNLNCNHLFNMCQDSRGQSLDT